KIARARLGAIPSHTRRHELVPAARIFHQLTGIGADGRGKSGGGQQQNCCKTRQNARQEPACTHNRLDAGWRNRWSAIEYRVTGPWRHWTQCPDDAMARCSTQRRMPLKNFAIRSSALSISFIDVA